MPTVPLFVKWVRGDTVVRKVLGAPGTSGNENATIGSGGGAGQLRPYGHGQAAAAAMDTAVGHDSGSEEYMMHEIGGVTKLTDVLVETDSVPHREGGEWDEWGRMTDSPTVDLAGR